MKFMLPKSRVSRVDWPFTPARRSCDGSQVPRLNADAGDPLLTLAIALGIGLLVGVERERRKGSGSGRAAAGIRTFALVGLLGGLAAVIGGDAALLVAGLWVAGAAALSYALGDRSDPGITTETAMVVVFLLGALAESEPELAAAGGVAVTVVLASREWLHSFVQRVLTEDELHDGLLFAAATLVVLPLAPDDTVGPLDVFNPFKVWLLVVLVMGVSGAGYIAMRAVGPGIGLAVSGLAGGFVSSSATIAGMGNRAKQEPKVLRPAIAGAVLSTIATILQMALVIGAASETTLRELAVPLLAGGAVAALYGLVFAVRALRGHHDAGLHGGRAFSLRGAVAFALIVTAILFLSAGLERWLGENGVTIAAAAGGFADTHAAGISVAQMVAAGKLDPSSAVVPVLAAMTTNSLTKIVLAVAGGRRFAWGVVPGIIAVALALWVAALVSPGG